MCDTHGEYYHNDVVDEVVDHTYIVVETLYFHLRDVGSKGVVASSYGNASTLLPPNYVFTCHALILCVDVPLTPL